MKNNMKWRRLTKTVNKLNRINRVYRNTNTDSTYREKAEMMRLKLSIDKLKKDLKEAQKSNLSLLKTNDELVAKLSAAETRLSAICLDIQELNESLTLTPCDA